MSLHLSSKHGVAPAIEVCCICGEDTGSLILLGRKADRIKGYGEGGTERIGTGNICTKCADHINEGAVAFVALDGSGAMLLSKQFAEANAHLDIKPGVLYRMQPGDYKRFHDNFQKNANKEGTNGTE